MVAAPALDGGGGGVLDLGIGVLHAERHDESPGCAFVERTLQGVALGVGDLGERRHAADGDVAGGEIGERLGRGWSAAPDVGVVRLDLARIARRPVRHQDHRDTGGHAVMLAFASLVCSWTKSTTACSTPGSVSGGTPWPRLKMWPWRAAGVVGRARRRHASPGERGVGAGQHERRVEVALHHEVVAEPRRARR